MDLIEFASELTSFIFSPITNDVDDILTKCYNF